MSRRYDFRKNQWKDSVTGIKLIYLMMLPAVDFPTIPAPELNKLVCSSL